MEMVFMGLQKAVKKGYLVPEEGLEPTHHKDSGF